MDGLLWVKPMGLNPSGKSFSSSHLLLMSLLLLLLCCFNPFRRTKSKSQLEVRMIMLSIF